MIIKSFGFINSLFLNMMKLYFLVADSDGLFMYHLFDRMTNLDVWVCLHWPVLMAKFEYSGETIAKSVTVTVA